MHTDSHPLAGQSATLKTAVSDRGITYPAGTSVLVEDWWDVVTGSSWMWANGNYAAMNYGIRSGLSTPQLPMDDEVVYVKIEGLGYIIHESELAF